MKNKTLASRLNRIITIENPEIIQDGAGGHIDTWKELGKFPASIKAIGDFRQNQGEYFSQMQLISYGFYQMIIRYRSDITNKMRVFYDSKYFNIKRVINSDEKNQYLILIVEEGVYT